MLLSLIRPSMIYNNYYVTVLKGLLHITLKLTCRKSCSNRTQLSKTLGTLNVFQSGNKAFNEHRVYWINQHFNIHISTAKPLKKTPSHFQIVSFQNPCIRASISSFLIQTVLIMLFILQAYFTILWIFHFNRIDKKALIHFAEGISFILNWIILHFKDYCDS